MIKGYKIIAYEDVRADLEQLHRLGWDSGKYVGFPSFEDRYSMLLGNCTDWTGYPQSGKTELLLELLMFMSTEYGWKHMLWMPDVGKAVEIMAKLIHKHTGKTFVKRYPNYIDIKKVYESAPWLLEHFKILHREDRKAKQLSPLEFWNYAAEYATTHGLHTATIDSWKDMRHDYAEHGGGYAQYLSAILPQRNEIAEQSKLHFHTIVHPKNPVRDKKRKVYAPFPDDMEGGAQWNSSGKCIIAVHRENWNDTVTEIFFRKIKPESVGRAAMDPKVLMFDVAKSRYYWIDGTTHEWVYAEPKDKGALRTTSTPIDKSQVPIDFTQSSKEEEIIAPF